MKPTRQPGLFDIEERAAQLSNIDGLLVGLKARTDREAFGLNWFWCIKRTGKLRLEWYEKAETLQ